MFRRAATLAVALSSLASTASALDVIQSTTVSGRQPPAAFCTSSASAGGIAINRADGTVAFCGPTGVLSAPRLLIDPTKAFATQMTNLDLSGMTVTNGGTTSPLSTVFGQVQSNATAISTETARATNAESLLAPLASPNLTGTPTVPTAGAGANTSQIANTSFVTSALANYLTTASATATYAPLSSPNLTGTPTVPTATGGSSTTQIANTSFVASALSSALANYLTSANATTTYAPQNNPFFTGTMQMGGTGGTPATQGLGYQFYARRNLTGSLNGGVNASLINVEQDTATLTGPNFGNYFTVQGFFGGSSVQGGRQAIQAQVYQTAVTNASNANRNYVGVLGGMYTSSGDGGTGTTPSTALGGYFGMNPVAVLQSGATNVLNASAMEVNYAAQTGSSVYYKSGLQIAPLASNTVQATGIDAAITIGSQGGVPIKTGIYIGTQNGQWPFDGSSDVIKAVGGQVKSALDFSGVGITDALLKGPSGGLYDIVSSFQIAHGGSVLMQFIGGAGQGFINIVGRAGGLSPVYTSPDDVIFRTSGSGTLDMNFPTTTTAPAAGGGGALPATPLGYATIKINGTSRKFAYY